MSRLDELYAMKATIEAAIEREKSQLWAVADLRDQVHDLLSRHTATTAATLAAASRAYNVEVVDVVGRGREAEVTAARHVAAWLLRDQGLSYPEIGRVLERDHTTVMHSCHRVAASIPMGKVAERLRSEIAAYGRQQQDEGLVAS